MNCRILLILATWIFSGSALGAESQIIRVGYDDYCPYTCANAPQKGFALDILEWILARRNIRLRPILASWPRIKSMAQKGQLDILLPVNQSEIQELGIARTQRPIGFSTAGYFVHKDSNWSYAGFDSLRDQIIGGLQGYTYPAPLSNFLADPRFQDRQLMLASDDGNKRQIKMLASQRVTVIPLERIVFWYTVRQLGLTEEFKEAGVLDLPEAISLFYIGVSSKSPELARDLLHWLDQGLEELIRTRRIQEMLQRYGIEATGK